MEIDMHYYLPRRMRGKRNKRRNRHPRFTCPQHKQFCKLMDSYYGKTDNFTVEQVKKHLLPYAKFLKLHYEVIVTHNSLEHRDYRSGFETYGYKNDEYILSQLDYISDRWNCAFRVRWLINLIDPDYNYDGRKKEAAL